MAYQRSLRTCPWLVLTIATAGCSDRPSERRPAYVLDARRGGPHGIEWTINGKTYAEHEVTELTPGRFVKVRFQNAPSRMHPMHIHGQFFKVIERNGVPAGEPFFRDAVLLRRKETIDVGMVPIDWGKWMMHCHILEHAEAGMMTIVEVGDEDD